MGTDGGSHYPPGCQAVLRPREGDLPFLFGLGWFLVWFGFWFWCAIPVRFGFGLTLVWLGLVWCLICLVLVLF